MCKGCEAVFDGIAKILLCAREDLEECKEDELTPEKRKERVDELNTRLWSAIGRTTGKYTAQTEISSYDFPPLTGVVQEELEKILGHTGDKDE